MTIKVIAAIFAVYESYKLLNTASFKVLIDQTKEAGKLENPPQLMQLMPDPFFRRVMIIELAYMIFALALLFTAYWYFTIVLFTLSIAIILLDTTGRKGTLILATGSAISLTLLMTIILA